MSYYEKLGWEVGKENEIFLKKGPEKLFFEILEKLDPKYVEVFKELLKYINKNSIVVFIPHFFPDGQNKEIQTYDELMEYAGKYDSVQLIKIIEIEPRNKEKLLNFDEAIVESEIWLRSHNLKTTSFDMKKIFDTGYFSTVEPKIDRKADNTVSIVYEVNENPVIQNINFEGNTLYKDAELEKALGVKRGKILNSNLLEPDENGVITGLF